MSAVGWQSALTGAAGGVALLIVLMTAAAGLFVYAFWRRAPGRYTRALASGALILAVLSPAMVRDLREPLRPIVLLVHDQSASQKIGARPAQSLAARERVEQAVADAGAELRAVTADTAPAGGTRLFERLEGGLVDLPLDRLAGVVVISDGQIHDTASARLRRLKAPVHALISGERDAADARIEVIEAPRYAIVGKPVTLRFRIHAPPGQRPQDFPVTLRQPGGEETRLAPAPDGTVIAPLTLEEAGPHLIEAEIPELPGESTVLNNRVAAPVSGIRDRLQVLLVTGRPYAGERVWRSMLKSDPAVDLVHFTILKPPTAVTAAPVHELSLIEFPVQELFEERLYDFDLIIFDQYERRGVLPRAYLRLVTDYVRQGGALMIAAGPSFASATGLYDTPLRDILLAAPTGAVFEAPYRPAPSAVGAKHPVTAGLPGAPESWGRWHRLIGSEVRTGESLLADGQDRPLLIVGRVGEGRLAQLMSDHVWLWARGYDGGGPASALLRRTAHWLMKEPDLEEERLTAHAEGKTIVVRRRSLGAIDGPLALAGPDGEETAHSLETVAPGRAETRIEVETPGIYRVRHGGREHAVAVGADRLEFSDVAPTDAVLRPISTASGGGVHFLATGVPAVRWRDGGRAMTGDDWIGLKKSEAFRIAGQQRYDLVPPWLWLLLAIGTMALAWWREGRH